MTVGTTVSRILGAALVLAASLAGAAGPASPGAPESDSCISCHGRLSGRLGDPVKEHGQSIHRAAGVTCVTCHGGDPDVPDERSMDPVRGFRKAPRHRDIPQFCASCHSDAKKMRQYHQRTDQFDEYRRSAHGRRLYEKGDANVAVCTSCHGTHGIRRVIDPLSPVYPSNVPAMCGRCHSDPGRMKPYGLPTGQLADFEKGVHGKILVGAVPGKNPRLAPSCASCHGVHGAAPPGVGEVVNVCGGCHAAVAAFFRESVHAARLSGGEAKCVTCHGNHSNRKPSLSNATGKNPGECGSCHDETSAAFAFAKTVRDILGGLEATVERLQETAAAADAAGQSTEKLRAPVESARRKLLEAGSALHAFSLERLLPIIHEAEEHIGNATAEVHRLRQVQSQRRTAGGIGVSVLAVLAALLIAKLRDVAPAPPPAPGRTPGEKDPENKD